MRSNSTRWESFCRLGELAVPGEQVHVDALLGLVEDRQVLHRDRLVPLSLVDLLELEHLVVDVLSPGVLFAVLRQDEVFELCMTQRYLLCRSRTS